MAGPARAAGRGRTILEWAVEGVLFPVPRLLWRRLGAGRAVAVVLLAIGTAGNAAGGSEAVYYVAPGGSDAPGAGPAAKPWATISAAVWNAPETGGTILVRDGLYQGNVKISRKFRGLLVIRAENAYRARLRNDDYQTLSIWDAANVAVMGFDIARGKYPTDSPLCAQIARSESIALVDNIMHDSFNNDVLKINEASRNLLIMGNVFYNQEGPAGQHIDVNGATEVTIRDNIFFNDYSGSPYGGKDSHGFIVVKNSGGVPEARRTRIACNVFLNWVGGTGSNFVLFGEDGLPFYEYQDAVVENNLMIGNSAERMRSPFSSKGAKNIVFRNNTITGDLPSSAYAVRFTQGGPGVMNKSFQLLNNIWSDPFGTMGNFADGFREEAVNLVIDRNLYWNGGQPIPIGRLREKRVAQYTDDRRAIVADPKLPPIGQVVLPRWTGESFRSGTKTIRKEFERLVRLYGAPGASSAAIGAADPAKSPRRDILDRVRGARPDLGAVQVGAASSGLRIVLAAERLTGGGSSTLNQVVLRGPAGRDGLRVSLRSADPNLASVPASVRVPPGAAQAWFNLSTFEVRRATRVAIVGTAGKRRGRAVLTLTPAGVSDVNLGPETLTAGADHSTRNLVYMDGVAGKEGLTVALSSSKPDLVSVPESVRIAPGKSYSEFFPVHTHFVAAQTTATITARLGSSRASGTVTLAPPKFQVILRNDGVAGEMITGPNRVTLGSPAPAGGGTVALSSSDPGLFKAPKTIPVGAGRVVAEFLAETGAAAARTDITVTARYGGETATARCWVVPLRPFRLRPSGPIPSGGKGSVGLTLNGPPAKDTRVDISVPAGAPVVVPATVVVPAGHWGTTIPVEGKMVSSRRTVKLTASRRGEGVSVDLEVVAPQPDRLRSQGGR